MPSPALWMKRPGSVRWRASLPINPASPPFGLLCTVKKDSLLTCGSSIQIQFGSCQSLSHVQLFATPGTAARQASLTPGACPDSCPSRRWCHPAISSSVVPFSSCLQSFPASGSFPVSRSFTSGGHSIGVSASASVLPINIQDWSPLGWIGWISLQSKGLSRVFSNTTV